jgi:hypothetical protein
LDGSYPHLFLPFRRRCMINCPNCDKEIADDTAHCGYCGHQLEEKEKKKTMFGMAALDGQKLEEAVAKAKQARGDEDDSSDSGGGLKIPKPGQKQRPKSGSKGAGGLKIPKPGQRKKPVAQEPEAQGAPVGDSPQDSSAAMAKTERIDLSDAPHPSDELDAQPSLKQPAGRGQDDVVQARDTEEDLRAGAVDHIGPTDVDDDDPGQPAGPAAGFGPSEGAGAGPDIPAADDQPGEPAGPAAGFGPPEGAIAEPDAPAADDQPAADDGAAPQLGEPAGPGQGRNPLQQMQSGEPSAPQSGLGADAGPGPGAPAGPGGPEQGGFGQKEIDTGAPPAEKKSKKGLIIVLVIFVLLGGLGCLGGVAYFLINHTHLFS